MKELVEAALALRGAAPDEWSMFLEALSDHTTKQVNKVVDCDPSMLIRAQGMAMAMRDLEVIFRTAPELHAKAQEKKQWPTNQLKNPYNP